VKRRELLSIAAVGGISGCFSSDPDSTVLGFEQPVETVVCGDVVGTPCNKFDNYQFDENPPEQVSSRRGGHAGARRRGGRIRIEGDILGIGDSRCRGVNIPLVEKRKKEAYVIVRNYHTDARGACQENARYVNYLLYIEEKDAKEIDTVQLKHYEQDGTLSLSGRIEL
jgi:hypothetical protein